MRAVALLCLLVLSPCPAMAANILYFTSAPGSWIGQGQTRTINALDGFTFRGFRYFDQNAATNAVRIDVSSPSESWDLSMVGAGFTFPGPGYYPNATRWPFQDDNHSGLEFSGNGRGNNSLSGEFTVYEAEYTPNGTLTKFAADFIQFDEMKAKNWVKGSIRLNSTLPIPIPEASTVLLSAIGALTIAIGYRSRKKASDSTSR